MPLEALTAQASGKADRDPNKTRTRPAAKPTMDPNQTKQAPKQAARQDQAGTLNKSSHSQVVRHYHDQSKTSAPIKPCTAGGVAGVRGSE